MNTIEEKFEDYIQLYKNSAPFKRLKPRADETYNVLKYSNVDIRVVDRDKSYNILFKLQKIKHFTLDTPWQSNRYFYMIPVQTVSGTIVGFILRTLEGKTYNTVNRKFDDFKNKVPLMFGLYSDFKNYNSKYPIVICEGLKDCILLKHFYPYVLAMNTNMLGLNIPILKNISNKFILAYDNDPSGKEGVKKDSQILGKNDCYVEILKCANDMKDWAQHIHSTVELKKLKKNLATKIKSLM